MLQTRRRLTTPLSGLAVAALAWDDPSLRAQSDVDWLVPADRMADAERALVDAVLARPRACEDGGVVSVAVAPRASYPEFTGECENVP